MESHFHGACGETFQEIDRKGLEKIAAYEAAHGITTIIPTISGSSEAVMDCDVEAVVKGHAGREPPAVLSYAEFMWEGPFLSPLPVGGAHRGKRT